MKILPIFGEMVVPEVSFPFLLALLSPSENLGSFPD
jgi:hypothetical protein